MARQDYYHYIADGGLFYDNLGKVGKSDTSKMIWRGLKIEAQKRFNTVSNVASKKVKGFAEIGDSLIEQGERELEHEIAVLRDIFGTDIDFYETRYGDYTIVIRALNEALNVKDVFEQALKLIRGEIKTKSGKAMSSSSIMDSAARLYNQYLDEILEKEYGDIINSLCEQVYYGTINESSFNNAIQTILDSAFDEAFDRVFNANPGKQYGSPELGQPFKELEDAVDQIVNFRRRYKQAFFSRFGFDNLYQKLMDEKQGNSEIKSAADLVKAGKKKYRSKLKGRTGALNAGIVQEYISMLLSYTAATVPDSTTGELIPLISSIRTEEAGGHGGASNTDLVHGLGLSIEADVIQAYQNNKTNPLVKESTRRAMEDFYDLMSGKLSDSAIVFESTKEYNLGQFEKFNELGFKGTTYGRKDLISLLNDLDFYRADNFVNAYMNSAPGAILENWTSGQEVLRSNIARAMGALLFDDYQIEGRGGLYDSHIIYVFRLSNIVVPLSYLLIRAGEAYRNASDISDAEDWVYIQATFPDRVYSNAWYEDKPNAKNKIDTSFEGSIKRWNEQLKIDNSRFKVTIYFLSNFVALLTGDLEELASL